MVVETNMAMKIKQLFFFFLTGTSNQIPQNLYGMFVSINQWDFVNRGALTCFFGLTVFNFRCRRPITGQYVTLTVEYEHMFHLSALTDLKVFGFRKFIQWDCLYVKKK